MMRAPRNRPASLYLVVLPLMVGMAAAASPDRRLVDAVAERDTAAVRALLKEGVDVNTARADGATALLLAAHWNDREAIDLLLHAGADGNGDIETAKVLIAAGARVNDTVSDGTHPLPYAIVIGQSAFAHFLLEQGADPNGALDGITALHAAAGPVDTWIRAWNRRHG